MFEVRVSMVSQITGATHGPFSTRDSAERFARALAESGAVKRVLRDGSTELGNVSIVEIENDDREGA